AGSPGVIVYGYDGLLMHPVALPSPDYVPRPEHPPSPDYGDKAPIEDQPLPADASPTALSPGYVADFDPKEDPEEDHANYHADGGDGDDEPSDDDDDDDDVDDEDEEASEDEDDDKKEEEHLAPADSSAVPISLDYCTTLPDRLRRARKTVRPQTHIPFPSEAEVDRLLSLPTPPPSPLTPLSSLLPQIPSPPLHVSSPQLPLPSPLTTSPTDVGAPLGYRAVVIRMRAASPPLLLPSTSHRTDILEAPRKRACFTTLAPRFEVRESSAAGAARQPGPTLEADLRRDRGVNQRVTELATTVRQDTDEFYVRFEDVQECSYRSPCQDTRGTGCDIDGSDFITLDSVDYNTWKYSDTRG
ncbi:hypothetical protein Tco_1552973, partial [Tanacetum coccineum]